MLIEVLGVPCPQCELTMEIAKKALAAMNVQAELVHVKDMGRILEAGVMMTPPSRTTGVEANPTYVGAREA